jgi:hypothetical protein
MKFEIAPELQALLNHRLSEFAGQPLGNRWMVHAYNSVSVRIPEGKSGEGLYMERWPACTLQFEPAQTAGGADDFSRTRLEACYASPDITYGINMLSDDEQEIIDRCDRDLNLARTRVKALVELARAVIAEYYAGRVE